MKETLPVQAGGSQPTDMGKKKRSACALEKTLPRGVRWGRTAVRNIRKKKNGPKTKEESVSHGWPLGGGGKK